VIAVGRVDVILRILVYPLVLLVDIYVLLIGLFFKFAIWLLVGVLSFLNLLFFIDLLDPNVLFLVRTVFVLFDMPASTNLVNH